MKFNHTAHRELWDWLSKNPDKSKHNWPGWKVNGGQHNTTEPVYYCFACEYAFQIMEIEEGTDRNDYDLDCSLCPLKEWSELACSEDFNVGDNNPCMSSHYNEWTYSEGKERKEFAEKIRDLEVAEGVEYE